MKLLIFILSFLAFSIHVEAQKCLHINMTQLAGKLTLPDNAKASYEKCSTTKNAHNQNIISSYGQDLDDLDSLLSQTMQQFNKEAAAISNIKEIKVPSQQDIASTKELANELKSMTPAQQKAFAMQMAQQEMKQPQMPVDQEDPTKAVLVQKTFNIAVVQMSGLVDEFSAKLHEVDLSMDAKINAVQKADLRLCKDNSTGIEDCDCANNEEAKYWQKIVAITDKENQIKKDLMLHYLEKLKAMTSVVDNNILACHYGDALKSTNYKRMLFRAQSSTFSNLFLMSVACMHQIRERGANAFINKVNCDNKVYVLNCGGL